MDLVASALGQDRIQLAEMDPRSAAARHCLGAYYAELARRFEEGFEVSRSRDPEAAAMMRPHGAFLVALSDGLPIGCVGLKGASGAFAEIKRLWVSPAARGLGLGRRLMDAAEDAARALGIAVLRLDTNRALPEALALYRGSGWRRSTVSTMIRTRIISSKSACEWSRASGVCAARDAIFTFISVKSCCRFSHPHIGIICCRV